MRWKRCCLRRGKSLSVFIISIRSGGAIQPFPAGAIFDKRVKKWYFLKDYGYISGTENEM